MRRALLASGLALGLAACASAPPEVHYPGRAAAGGLSAQGPFAPNAELPVCPGSVSNAPRADWAGFMRGYNPLILVNGIVIAAAPANDVCLSSGFGRRFGRMHEGIDLRGNPGDPIFAAAPGIVREARTANGYGLYIVLDHGRGVYTRYAHLSRFAEAVRPGQRFGFGQQIGRMGETGNATAVHLHFEVLTGNWGPKGSFGLKAHDPLTFPAYRWQEAAS